MKRIESRNPDVSAADAPRVFMIGGNALTHASSGQAEELATALTETARQVLGTDTTVRVGALLTPNVLSSRTDVTATPQTLTLTQMLGRAVRRIRTNLDWSQRRMAKEINTTQSAVSDIETGAGGSFNTTTLSGIAAATGNELGVVFLPKAPPHVDRTLPFAPRPTCHTIRPVPPFQVQRIDTPPPTFMRGAEDYLTAKQPAYRQQPVNA